MKKDAGELKEKISVKLPPEKPHYRSINDLFNSSIDKDLKYIHEYAALCDLVYKNERPEQINGWQPANVKFQTKSELKVQAWYKFSGSKVFVAIVFRGTRFTHWRDWWHGNLSIISHYVSESNSYYFQVIREINGFIEALKKEIENTLIQEKIRENDTSLPTLVFATTGHSLGGGLAQACSYAHPEISLTYAINSSWITFYTTFLKNEWEKNCNNLKVFRLSELGEILQYFRFFVTQSYRFSTRQNENPKYVVIRVNFLKSWFKTITSHSSSLISNGLKKAHNDYKKMKINNP